MTTTAVTPIKTRKIFDATIKARRLFKLVRKHPEDASILEAFHYYKTRHDLSFDDMDLTIRDWWDWVKIVNLTFREKRGP